MTFYREEKGLTLIELLIAMVLAVVLTIGAYRAFSHQQKAYTIQDQVTAMQQELRATMMTMVREIRMAGFIDIDDNITTDVGPDPLHPFFDTINENIEWAANDAICFEADVDNDGLTETIMYSFTPGVGLRREEWQWDPATGTWGNNNIQLISANCTAMFIGYLLTEETVNPPEIAPPWPSPSGLTRQDIRSVNLVLTFRTSREDPDFQGGVNIQGTAADGTCRIRGATANIELRNSDLRRP